MDDFGTGCSSLSYLRSFPFDKIKIDRSFVSELAERKDSMAIVRAVTGLGRSLGIPITADGVETSDQMTLFRSEGCSEVQGHLVSPPLLASEVDKMFPKERLYVVAQNLALGRMSSGETVGHTFECASRFAPRVYALKLKWQR